MTPDLPATDPLQSALLAALDDEARAVLFARAQPRRFAASEAIFYQGDAGDFLFVIDAGRVEISTTAANGRRAVLNHMGAGEILGEIAVLDRGARSADARAATDVELRVLYRADLMAFLAEHPAAMGALLAELCARVRNASEMFALQSQISAQSRLARALLRIGAKWGAADRRGHIKVAQSFSHGDLGALCGLARENVSRHMKGLAKAGLLRFDEGQLTLLDLEGLEEIAEY
ncbi:MAG: Crp/Fnr family transcriptional regulator [Paracoccaceae bacterium]